MGVTAPPQPSPSPDAGVIEDARRRQRRRRRVAIVSLLALAAGLAFIAGGRFGGGTGRVADATGGSFMHASVGFGITVRYPSGWHLYRPPITSVSSPLDRLLITSYRARTGGECSPTRAENALPPNGALVYLFEYSVGAGPVLIRAQSSGFPPRPHHFALGAYAQYECWAIPSYLVRFRAAGRLFQAQIALGLHAGTRTRAQVLRVLDSLRVRVLR